MGEDKKTNNNSNNNKIELSLSAIMFFSPLIQNLIKKNNLSPIDKNFIKGFIKIGYLNILLLILTIALQIIFYITKIGTIQLISTVLLIILASSLVIGSIYAISNKSIIKTADNNANDTDNTDITQNKLAAILNYIPLYNIYLRYKNHKFDNPDLILKESLLVWSLSAIIFIVFQDQTINRILITIIGIRIITLANDIDFGITLKYKLNKLFKKNPEELRGYISGTIITLFNKKVIEENIIKQKNNYELLFKLNNKQIIFEYAIFNILVIYGLYRGYINNQTTLIFSILFIISRYIIMIIKRNHLPHIPVIREVTSIFFKIKTR